MEENNMIDDYLSKLPEEERKKLEADIAKQINYIEQLDRDGKVFGTPTSISLDILRENGFNPIGITTMTCEETFIFNTKEEATKAYNMFEHKVDETYIGGVCGWWYGKDNFELERITYENDMGRTIKVHWLI